MKKMILSMLMIQFMAPQFAVAEGGPHYPPLPDNTIIIQNSSNVTVPFVTPPLSNGEEVILYPSQNPDDYAKWSWGLDGVDPQILASAKAEADKKKVTDDKYGTLRDTVYGDFVGCSATPLLSDNSQNYCKLGYLGRAVDDSGNQIIAKPGVFGFKGLGKNSLYCQNCEQEKIQKNLLEKTAEINLNKRTKEYYSKLYQQRKLENWGRMLGQTRKQILQLKVGQGVDVTAAEKACGAADYNKSLTDAIDRIVSKYKGKDSGKCSALTNDPKSDELKKKMLEVLSYKRDGGEGVSNEAGKGAFKRGNHKKILDMTKGLREVTNDYLLEDTEMGPEKYCMYNSMDAKGLEFGHASMFNHVAKSISLGSTAEEFSNGLIQLLSVDPRFDFILGNTVINNQLVNIKGILGGIFKVMYKDINETSKKQLFGLDKAADKQAVDQAINSIQIGQYANQEAMVKFLVESGMPPSMARAPAAILSMSIKNMDISRGKIDSAAITMVTAQCNSLFSDDFESLVCGEDDVDISDVQLLLELNPRILHCSTAKPEADTLEECYEFNRLMCSRFGDDDKKSPYKHNVANLHNSVQNLLNGQDLRETYVKKANEKNPEFKGCEEIALNCIQGKSNRNGVDYADKISKAVTSVEKSDAIKSCETDYWSDVLKSKKTSPQDYNPQEVLIVNDWTTKGKNCEVLKDKYASECNKNKKKKQEDENNGGYVVENDCLTCSHDNGGNQWEDSLDDYDDLNPNNNFPGTGGTGGAKIVGPTDGSLTPSDEQINNSGANQLVNTVAPQVVNNLNTQTKKVESELKAMEEDLIKNGKDPQTDPDYARKLKEKADLEQQTRDLQAQIDELRKKKDGERDKEIADLRKDLAETKKLVNNSNVPTKKKKTTSIYDQDEQELDENGNFVTHKKKDGQRNEKTNPLGAVATPGAGASNNRTPSSLDGSGSGFGGSSFGGAGLGGGSSNTNNQADGNPTTTGSNSFFVGTSVGITPVSDPDVIESIKGHLTIPKHLVEEFKKNPKNFLKSQNCVGCSEDDLLLKVTIEGGETYSVQIKDKAAKPEKEIVKKKKGEEERKPSSTKPEDKGNKTQYKDFLDKYMGIQSENK